jgi:hypothetical protein
MIASRKTTSAATIRTTPMTRTIAGPDTVASYCASSMITSREPP